MKGITLKICRLCVCVIISKRSFESLMYLDLTKTTTSKELRQQQAKNLERNLERQQEEKNLERQQQAQNLERPQHKREQEKETVACAV